MEARKEVLVFKKGDILFREEGKPNGIHCLREGKLKIFKHGSDGREHITRLAFPGEFVGMKAILTGTPYSVSAQALEDSVTCFIPKAEFFSLTIRYPEFTSALIGCLSQQLVDAEAKMVALAHKPVKQRLAETLLYLYQQIERRQGRREILYLNLTRQDLANIIGTAQETVIRLLADWKDQHILEIKGRKIFVLDDQKLTNICNGIS